MTRMGGKIGLLYPDISYRITGLCYKVHNDLGRFCSERQYADALERFFVAHKIPFLREYNLETLGKEMKGSFVDFLVEDKIIIDLKAKKFITKEDYYQMLRYLTGSGLKLGLIVNFRNTYLRPKRVINVVNFS